MRSLYFNCHLHTLWRDGCHRPCISASSSSSSPSPWRFTKHRLIQNVTVFIQVSSPPGKKTKGPLSACTSSATGLLRSAALGPSLLVPPRPPASNDDREEPLPRVPCGSCVETLLSKRMSRWERRVTAAAGARTTVSAASSAVESLLLSPSWITSGRRPFRCTWDLRNSSYPLSWVNLFRTQALDKKDIWRSADASIGRANS